MLLSEIQKLKKKLQQEINKMTQSKEVVERNIPTYDEDRKWHLTEQGHYGGYFISLFSKIFFTV